MSFYDGEEHVWMKSVNKQLVMSNNNKENYSPIGNNI